MHAEVIAIGDEITSGQLLDTNTQWLSQRLEELGIRVLYHTTVGDEIQPCADVFRRAVARADVVVATGGLGPTADDLTREAIALAAGRELVLDPHALKHVRDMFARRQRQMPERNERQAEFPDGATMIDNPNGTAPGIALELPREGVGPCRLFALPGVPPEVHEMWHGSVADALRQFGADRKVVRHRRLKCFGAGESHVEAMLPDMIRRGRTPRVGINASKTTIILRITAEGVTEQECDAAMEPTIATIRQCLGNLVFGQDDDELQDAVVRLLRRQNRTLATVEWGTAGMVAQWLGDAAEGKGLFLGGLVTTSAAALHDVLGVDQQLLAPHSATSAEAVAAMARSCRDRFGADYALAVGRFPEFDPTAAEPNPVFMALAVADGVQVKSYPFAGHPATLKIFCGKRALNTVRLAMLGE
ncbi:MAG: CinA family nicotinamide mononucleotide deamidase-related protein [Pirellulales bacterium]|nr:CinA family nicotinamide mononucleotide deamidase-related protein [Pirellulales bacterium]